MLNAALGVRIVQGVGGKGGVQPQQDRLGQWFLTQTADGFHRPEVVEDHPLAPVPRRSSRPIMFLGDNAGGGRALELTGGDRLLDQRIDDEPVTQRRIRYVLGAPSRPRAWLSIRCRAC